MSSKARTVIVVPCYDEAERFPAGDFLSFAEEHEGIHFILVNDGSRDDTLRVLDEVAAARPASFDVLDLERNQGKAEAVRRGMVQAFERADAHVGYWDADLATPLPAILELAALLDADESLELAMGSRVRLLGHAIDRQAKRHYLGRIFATAASLCLELPVYDTQCGAKLFRARACNAALFAEPFDSGWIFDVEVLARMTQRRRTDGEQGIEDLVVEHPLKRWEDVGDSKVKTGDFVRAVFQLAGIRRRYFGGNASESA